MKIVNKSDNELPEYGTYFSAGMDIRAFLQEPVILEPFERKLIPTGLYVEIPVGYEIQVRPRSGMALKNGVTVCNSPGTVDSDYRGELGVILINLSQEQFTVNSGDRIAQIVLGKFDKIGWELVANLKDLSHTDRGTGGYGSTGKI